MYSTCEAKKTQEGNNLRGLQTTYEVVLFGNFTHTTSYNFTFQLALRPPSMYNTPMQYDPFQKEAIKHINNGDSVIVSAPTGAGKTAIAEHVIETCLANNQKVIYTAPIKALSNQKYRDFSERYPDDVGILTGDVTINAQAPTLIMTTEIFRNKIIEEHSSLNDYSWIIFDEIHYLDDTQRGGVWEESLIFLPDHMQILGLSATIPNLKELADWIQKIHNKNIKVVIEDKRPVPLHFMFQCQNKIFNNLEILKEKAYRVAQYPKEKFSRIPKLFKTTPNETLSLIHHLKCTELLPCIYFVFGRRRTETLAKETSQLNFLNESEQKEIIALFDELCQKFDITQEPSTYELKPLVAKGIAYHHAGMLPTLKEVIERLFATRLIKVIFTTETFALGINMPAKSVCFDQMHKFYERSFRPLKTRDFFQMAGRAGRRSIDTEGFVFCRINPHALSTDDVNKMIYGEPEQVTSRFNASYATLLNLYEKFNEKLYDIYPLSFHHYQQERHIRKKALKQMHDKVHLLKQMGYIRKNQVTEKGKFAQKVYGYELLLSELYTKKHLHNLSNTELAVLCLAVIYEPRKGMKKPPLPRAYKSMERETKEVIRKIIQIEKRFNITPHSKPCYFHLSMCIESWMKNESFDQALKLTDADEGEVVRYFRMTIQMLRELLDAPLPDQLLQRIHKTIKIINRDVVDAEKQLRI